LTTSGRLRKAKTGRSMFVKNLARSEDSAALNSGGLSATLPYPSPAWRTPLCPRLIHNSVKNCLRIPDMEAAADVAAEVRQEATASFPAMR
jgi:hypothetical protein